MRRRAPRRSFEDRQGTSTGTRGPLTGSSAREQLDGENVLAVRVKYSVIDRNAPGNNVILPSIEQTVRMSAS